MGDEVEEEGKEDDSYIPSQDDLLGGSAKVRSGCLYKMLW